MLVSSGFGVQFGEMNTRNEMVRGEAGDRRVPAVFPAKVDAFQRSYDILRILAKITADFNSRFQQPISATLRCG